MPPTAAALPAAPVTGYDWDRLSLDEQVELAGQVPAPLRAALGREHRRRAGASEEVSSGSKHRRRSRLLSLGATCMGCQKPWPCPTQLLLAPRGPDL